ncbi:MAG: class I SAM-dependent methyltransferase [Desulfobacteraceae bacterium]|nr:class I SAM-dependent methyltransferase [Desulfobacteraceae bacterium]
MRQGRVCETIEKKGAARVMGMDYFAEMIKLAQIKEAQSPSCVEYRQMNMFDPEQLGNFYLVVAFSVISIASTKEELLNACKTITMNLKQGGRFITVGLNPEQYPKTYPFTEKYGFKVLNKPPQKEGDSLLSSIMADGKELFFEDYYFTHDSYEWAFKTAGFREIHWHKPVISPEGIEKYGKTFWQDFIDYQMSIYIECVK